MAVASNAADWPARGLDEAGIAADPDDQFTRWMADAEAFGVPEPTAMVLASVSAAGQPRARTVLLKGHDSSGFVFYTNRTSRKGTDLDQVPRACLLFPWHAMHRQVIIEGPVTAMSAAVSEAYFRTRPRESQLAAWASRQSSVISSRQELEHRYERMEQRWPDGEQVPLPGFWGGYLLAPDTVEFWHGRSNRMHDRLRYRRQAGTWVIERLAP
jgi:pyridoxamine 5'-phosphate oxidase